jgi:hypothetical protein
MNDVPDVESNLNVAKSMRFAEAAKQAFSFSEHAGFRLTQSGPARLQYETAQAFATIEWDAGSGELNVFVGPQPRNGEARDAFSLTDCWPWRA